MQTLTVKLPSELSERLKRRARELNRPKSEIVRQALAAKLNDEQKCASLLDRAAIWSANTPAADIQATSAISRPSD
jgi:predicted transcriptional regulator